MDSDTVRALREALALTPDNLPLRRHLAETLLKLARYDEAAATCREALTRSADLPDLELILAEAFRAAGKRAEALVVAETLCKRASAPARAHLVRARLLKAEGETEGAARAYRQAVERDETLADEKFAAELGVEDWQEADERERIPAGGLPQKGKASDLPQPMEKPSTAFADVGGMDAVKEQVRKKIIHPIRHPDLYKAYGKKIGGGILLYGPPGCGKTHLARATAGEVKAGFISVGINDVLNMYIGESEKNLHAIFEQARDSAPCVLFFDEVDALGASRTDMRQSAGRQMINQFLSELDGIDAANDGLLVLAATNAPWHLDAAFRRPGRFDRVIFVPPPDEPARAAVLRIQLRGKPVEDIDYEALAAKSKDFSGADLKACVDVAIEDKLDEAMKKGAPTPLTTKDLMKAVKAHKPTTKEWFATARNYALFSNQGGHYDDILEYLKLK